MSEEKDDATAAQEAQLAEAGVSGGGTKDDFSEIIPQVQPNPGMPERKAAARHRERVEEMLHTLPENAQRAIRESQQAEDEIREERQMVDAQNGNGRNGSDRDGHDDQYAGSDANTEQFPAYRAGNA